MEELLYRTKTGYIAYVNDLRPFYLGPTIAASSRNMV